MAGRVSCATIPAWSVGKSPRKNLYEIPISFHCAPSRTFMAIGSIFPSENTFGFVAKDATGHFRYIANSPVKFAKYKRTKGIKTMDMAVIGIGILFFALCFVYIKACDAL
ncbi:hypothetical protein EN962_17200 [Mesorhizobium sp. M7A.F.Ca.CA.001.09.2.1]|nr:hypothetical protein EN981_12610 [Mesorhizobium sp. M7A.F.Ca.CA.001.13.2.1]RUY62360.1 hypothetical protein EN965_25300 [Mesorhizobium sp. M7A.F.Ca.CA.001.05.1.1]RUY66480.1 hypothetical protein EN980_19855 [Mesorhizobium sp. M7A.F.Ca.CA.001.13.1.1]RUY77142.1 hypothetical protein EN962_17200 [Mesorhizobium sp. M7A.F.Ca.CA.001.09.2.1]RUZ09831.1 hypothetical protein EN955_02970 [Mesorhizobium sp. M7A.F.Ca.CA.001.04.2.1]RUZ21692.1 hypothetical protein EN961_12935 [Mesorhizobium sp. M7A.F.Ca.CA.0